MLDILNLDIFKAPAMLGFVEDRIREIHARSQYLGPTILPSKRVSDLQWEYVKGYGSVPVMARIVDFGSPSPIGRRRGRMELVRGELVTIKEKYEIDVKTLLKLRRALASGVESEIRDALQTIFDDVDRVLSSLAARVEWMRWQALTTGIVTYADSGITVELNYGLPQTNVAYASVPWSNVQNATPLTDLRNLCDTIQQLTGVRPARAVARLATWNELLWNEKETRSWIHGSLVDAAGNRILASDRPVLPTELRGLLAQLELPAFAIYDLMAGVEDPATKVVQEVPFIPDNVVVLLPPSNVEVGFTLFGPTPSEVFNEAGYGDAIKEMTEAPRYVVRIYKEGNDPGIVWTQGEVTAVPTLQGIQYVGVLHTRPQGP